MRVMTGNPMTEPLEPRRLMSADPTSDALALQPESQPAMLLPAIQAAREPATAPTRTKPLFAFYVEDLDAPTSTGGALTLQGNQCLVFYIG
jgi:hypothetical protein